MRIYINETAKDSDMKAMETQRTRAGINIAGNILYPSILKLITSFTNLFNQDEYSKLWNFINISITSILSIITFRLIRISTFNIFNKNISFIASLIYFINPYTYYFHYQVGCQIILYLEFLLFFGYFQDVLGKITRLQKQQTSKTFWGSH